MDAATDLTRALTEWSRLTALENQAILGGNWTSLAEHQARKAELQPAIERALGSLRDARSPQAAGPRNLEPRFGPAFVELTALEKRNADLLAARRQRCLDEAQRLGGPLRDLHGVRRAYGAPASLHWQSYS